MSRSTKKTNAVSTDAGIEIYPDDMHIYAQEYEDSLSRVEHPQPFCDITKCICDELKLCNNYSKSKEWFLAEIEMTREKIKAYAECFDGVIVDNKTRIELCKSHIRFCENAIKQLN